MKIMGLDYGSVTVGVAISDSMLLTAQPVEVIKRKSENKLRRTLARIEELVAEHGVEKIVLGFPKNMNNTEGERVERTREFMDKLVARTGLEVVLWDERLSTVSAMDVLKEGGVRSENRKRYVDKIAASLILQGYLDSIRNKRE
ncbi:MAG: Holliday junction resolvase RuvX [Eubacterium sp.]|nr:Holliday junction resolvase RuvX [Eubacterium sp.]